MVPVGDEMVALNGMEYTKVLCRGPDAWKELVAMVGTILETFLSMFLDFCHGAPKRTVISFNY